MPLLLAAYAQGIFPWYNEGQPVLWWSPAPRCVLEPGQYHLSRRSRRYQSKLSFTITMDRDFAGVITACASLRSQGGTWITDDVQRAYRQLFEAGFAHSVEAWQDNHLVGGLYGVALGRAFFGESMFHIVSEASRACLGALTSLLRQRGVTLLDCQQRTAHIMAQGGKMFSREQFTCALEDALTLRPDSMDALTLEYTELGTGGLSRSWPFLPWRSHWLYEDGHWKTGTRDLSGK